MTTEAYNNVTEEEFNAVMAGIFTPPVSEPKPHQWAVQVYNTDSCEWKFNDESQPTTCKAAADDEAHQIKRKCAYRIRTRVVKW